MKHRTRKATTNAPNPLRLDPSRTGLLRRAFAAGLRKRFARLRLAVYALVADSDAFGLRPAVKMTANEEPEETATPQRWRFLTSRDKVDAFLAWLRKQFGEWAVGRDEEELWTRYIEEGFRRGAGRAFDDARAGDFADEELGFARGTRQEFLRSAFGRPESVDKVRLLAGRAFDDLKGVTADMSLKMARTLADGLVRGDGPLAIARRLAAEVDITRGRAEVIARTEIIRAHAEGQLSAFEALGLEELGVMVEWTTAGDGRVCKLCAVLSGLVVKVAEAHGMIPRHPNCVTGDSIVRADAALALMKTHYTGQIVELVTAKGRRLSVTENHILLTEHGFVPARFVRKGMQIVDAAGFDSPLVEAPHHDRHEACIADVFAAWAEHPLMLSERVPLAPENLHGDGSACDAEVRVVWPNGKLWNNGKPVWLAEFPEMAFMPVQFSDTARELAGGRRFDQSLKRAARASDGSMGRFRDPLAFLLGRLLHANEHGFRSIPGLNPACLESFVDAVTAAPEAFRECLRAHPVLKQVYDFAHRDGESISPAMARDLFTGALQPELDRCRLDAKLFTDGLAGQAAAVHRDHLFDKVVMARTTHAKNLPVYDIQTDTTLYVANGLISSNCRCAFLPANVGESPVGQKRSKAAIDAAIARSAALGKDGFAPGAAIAADRPESILNALSPELVAFSRFLFPSPSE